MKKAFIYEWTDIKTGLKYIGRHVGYVDDGYIGSGTIFKKEYELRPSDFERNILWISNYIDDESVKLEEEKILSFIHDDELFYGKDPKYYNQVKNSHGFTCTDNPMLNSEIVDRMMKTRQDMGYSNVWKNTIAKYGKDCWHQMNSDNKKGNTFGSGNKNKTKTEEHKNKISASIQKMYDDKRLVGNVGIGGRPRALDYTIIIAKVESKGFKEAAIELDLSIAALKGRYYNAVKALKKTI